MIPQFILDKEKLIKEDRLSTWFSFTRSEWESLIEYIRGVEIEKDDYVAVFDKHVGGPILWKGFIDDYPQNEIEKGIEEKGILIRSVDKCQKT